MIKQFRWVALCALALSACGDGSGAGDEGTQDGSPDGASDGDDGALPAAYAFSSMLIGEDPSSYVSVLGALDGAQIDLGKVREFPGSSDMWTLDGFVYVASGDAPIVTKFSVDANNQLVEEATLSFANQGTVSTAFWNNTFVSATKAYMANGPTELVIWNPDTMTLAGTVAIPAQERAGFLSVLGLSDRAAAVRGDKVYQPLYFTDENYAERTDDSLIAVIDAKSDQFVEFLAAPCPGLDYATQDDEGNLYFSNWTGGVGTHLVLGTKATCVVKVDAADEVTVAFDFAAIAKGHEGAAFRYAGGGTFLMSVFDESRVDLEAAQDPFSILAQPNFQIWSYDAATGESAPLSTISWNSGAVYYLKVDDALLGMVPGSDYASTELYRFGGASPEKVFDVDGWSARVFRVR